MQFDGNFFDKNGIFNDIYNIPSLEDIFNFIHDDFSSILTKYGLRNQDGTEVVDDGSDSEDEDNFKNEDWD